MTGQMNRLYMCWCLLDFKLSNESHIFFYIEKFILPRLEATHIYLIDFQVIRSCHILKHNVSILVFNLKRDWARSDFSKNCTSMLWPSRTASMGIKTTDFWRSLHPLKTKILLLCVDKILASIVMNERAINNNVILSFLISLNVFCKVIKIWGTKYENY